MQLNTEDLRRHYASLNDESLLALKRDELVAQAQDCYDAELHRRGLQPKSKPVRVEVRKAEDRRARKSSEDELNDEGFADAPNPSFSNEEPEPDWLPDASCAVSFTVIPGGDAEIQLDTARGVLEAADIPCYSVFRAPDPPDAEGVRPIYELMVPGALNLKALSILDRDYYNPQMEEEWRAHFAALSDEDFGLLDLTSLTAGLQDRIERLTSAYNDECANRK